MRNNGLDEAQAGIKIAGTNINYLRYTDHTTLMAESEELKSLLMKVKEESEKVGLKLSIQKTMIMASGSITSWQIGGETVEAVTDFRTGKPDTLQSMGSQGVCHNLATEQQQQIELLKTRSFHTSENLYFLLVLKTGEWMTRSAAGETGPWGQASQCTEGPLSCSFTSVLPPHSSRCAEVQWSWNGLRLVKVYSFMILMFAHPLDPSSQWRPRFRRCFLVPRPALSVPQRPISRGLFSFHRIYVNWKHTGPTLFLVASFTQLIILRFSLLVHEFIPFYE